MAIHATLTGSGQYTDTLAGMAFEVVPEVYQTGSNAADLSISGDFDGRITLQRRFNDSPVWRDCDYFTAPYEGQFAASLDGEYRVGFQVGDYTSGTAVIRIGVGY